MDFNVRYTRDIGLGEFTADVRATRYSQQRSRVLPSDPMDEFNGTITAPRWVGDVDLRYKWKDWTAYYGMVYVGTQDSNEYLGVDPEVDPFNFHAGSYIQHNISLRYRVPSDWEVVFGIRNLTDIEPKTITPGAYSNRVGNSFLYSGYDYFDRRAYLSVSKTF